jgi:hypothetical protein
MRCGPASEVAQSLAKRLIERRDGRGAFARPRGAGLEDARRDDLSGGGPNEPRGELDLALSRPYIDLEHADLDIERHIGGKRIFTEGTHAPDRACILESLDDPALDEPGQPVGPLGVRERRQRAVRAAHQHVVRIERLECRGLGYDELAPQMQPLRRRLVLREIERSRRRAPATGGEPKNRREPKTRREQARDRPQVSRAARQSMRWTAHTPSPAIISRSIAVFRQRSLAAENELLWISLNSLQRAAYIAERAPSINGELLDIAQSGP